MMFTSFFLSAKSTSVALRSLSSKRTFTILACLTSLLIAGCVSTKEDGFLSTNTSEAELYKSAQKSLRRRRFQDAIEDLQTMEKLYPFGEYSKSAQLSLIYAHFGDEEPESARAMANRFIRLHPQHRNVDYAYYMKGLMDFPKAKTIFQRVFKVDLSKRDISEARASFNEFSTLVKRFPKSEYTPDALKRMEFLRNLLARHEIHVANYYFKRKAYLAAANRGRYVIENFQRTPAIPDALAIMAQGYHEMKLHDLSDDSVRTLRQNFPDYPALNADGSFDFGYYSSFTRSWINRLTFGVIGNSSSPGFNTEAQYNKITEAPE